MIELIILSIQGVKGNVEPFNRWLAKQLKDTPMKGMICYPEGTRNTANKLKDIKRGIIYFAFMEGLPTQVIVSRGNDDIISEKGFK
jgi:1-acyl-sn-glycerol-3-phosphate acyltransferase